MKKTFLKTLIPALCAVIIAAASLMCGFLPQTAADGLDVSIRGEAVCWNAISSATAYTVSVEDSSGAAVYHASFAPDTTFAGFFSLFRTGGVYTVTVTAYADTTPVASGFVTVEYHTVLAPPTHGTLENGVLHWTAVDGAASYTLTVNGISAGTYTEPSADIGGLLALSGEYTCSVTANGDGYNADSSPFVFTVTNSADPLPPYDAVVTNMNGTYIASWTPPKGYSPDYYVYTLVSNGEVLVSDTSAVNRADISGYVTDGGFQLTVTAVSDGRGSAPFTAAFTVNDGEVTNE